MRRRHTPAFSLLEVMVAMAILSVGLVSLLQVQSRSAQLAIEAREMTVATMLARGKLYDCQTDLAKKGFSVGDYDESGNFDDEGYPTFFWECHAYKPEMPVGEGVGDMGSAASALGMGTASAAAGTAGQAGAQPQGADMGMGMIAPVLQQMSSVMGDSIRELVIIVRWGIGADQQELRVTTHMVDKGPINNVANMIQQQTKQLGALTGQTTPDDGSAGGKGGPGGTGGGGGAGKTPGAVTGGKR
ncbi:MAG TPA: prepilin-type N-terminal cleavage/methylation domain-containing protein [Myxococcota bacterium]